ncbi:MAG: hypothetical protein A2504_16885 [Bdellovibrionales bacterium RIFOXYD12_FULL_39_22]|nr:MAG: hypothetical protein A2385_05825 [Bdellovibrionales bacterium RIFOXYB1_FULL_39_21]OFZ41471.1 MAG: hypothetical protein A2485_04575 [Bdellovibrionales bacterium RIFOXYC12_FULL_39_17]OFZ50373.1 MAG: hypothetical protein A2404_02405 [Bdellovibrionales bacterium RIFOXYC1_FULL_39_130]OFZ76140.1 MAG: hypothetical protein A2451_09235 [Bdellovibrionales bacterium RIFOXYC2_FULL_39_8]OFZ77652.1 MAG: hypothetical protein A2560_16480 [Bdellovibrionales bacterium RIFOXYD1_FULL_39_84]OFZ92191.1 MAG:
MKCDLNMKMFLLISAIALAFTSYAHAEKVIAITVDDLPGWESQNQNIQPFLRQITDTLNAELIPATGFVIGKLAAQSNVQIQSLHYWASHGLILANHTWDHEKYSSQSVDEFLVSLNKTQAFLKPFQTQYGPWPFAFRFPMLNQGDTKKQEIAANNYFFETQTMLAHVSVDTSDWAFAQYYRDFLTTDFKKANKLTEIYLEHIFDCVSYAEEASDKIFSKQIPQIILLHANQLNGKMMKSLIKGLRARGYSFISLEAALSSDVYLQFKYKIAYQTNDHFFYHMSKVLNKSLPSGPDRSSYEYFQTYWEKKISEL